MVDEDLPYGKEGGRKSWYLTVTQDRDLLTELGPVVGVPKKGARPSDDVVALVTHLMLTDLIVADGEGSALNGPAVDWLQEQKRAAIHEKGSIAPGLV